MLSQYYLNADSETQYLIAAAVRGADGVICAPSDAAKSIVTARVRAIMFESVPNGALFDRSEFGCGDDMHRLEAVVNESNIPGRRPPNHYMIHLERAVQATCSHPIWGGHGPAILTSIIAIRRGYRDYTG